MRILDRLRGLLRGSVPDDLRAAGLSEADLRGLDAAIEAEAARTPVIVLIGETGVGKTSTLNALFNKGLEISHAKACTQIETEVVGDRGGPITVFDMPGVGEDVDADEQHIETYRRVLPKADVVLLILKADNRAMTHVQTTLRRLTSEGMLDPNRLVVALNQVDLLQPGSWDSMINLPSLEQEHTIDARRSDVAGKLQKIASFPARQIVAYSARTFYNVEGLFEAMVLACGESRAWLLADRASYADFNQLVDPVVADANAECAQ